MITLNSILNDLSQEKLNEVVEKTTIGGGYCNSNGGGSNSKSGSSSKSGSNSGSKSGSNSGSSSGSNGGSNCYCICG